jgi:RimJ/RimL family protein N-acetyltransferase
MTTMPPPTRLEPPTQPIGIALDDWQPRPLPLGTSLPGRTVSLQRLDPVGHGASLHAALAGHDDDRLWTYLSYGPFPTRSDFQAWLEGHAADPTQISYAVVDLASGQARGLASYLRIDPAVGSLEIGHLCFGPALQRTTAATEALYLLLRHAFDALGYRRCEWKCDHLNGPSRRAAERLGFRFEGIHRNARVYKGRNRDTAWYAIIDSEWPALRLRLEAWMAPSNFDSAGMQRQRLA